MSDSGVHGDSQPPPATADVSVFALHAVAAPNARVGLRRLFVPAALTWVAVNAIWGLTSDGDTVASAAFARAAPLSVWVFAAVGASLSLAAASIHPKLKDLRGVAWMLVAYQLGVLVQQLTRDAVEAAGPLLDRSLMLLVAVPMLAVWFGVGRSEWTSLFRWGDWRVLTRVFGSGEKRPWSRRMAELLLFLALPVFLLSQASVDFGPVRSGAFLAALPAILPLALLNGFTEELLFRGLVMPPLVAVLGAGRGIWAQAVLFGRSTGAPARL